MGFSDLIHYTGLLNRDIVVLSNKYKKALIKMQDNSFIVDSKKY